MTSIQDWDAVKIGSKTNRPRVARKTNINAARREGAVVATERKITSGINKANPGTDHQRIAKLDRENEVAPPSKIPLSLGKVIQERRNLLGLTQKEVGQKINEKPTVLQEYEAGKAIPNAQILTKLERVLGISLRGNTIGKERKGSKKSPMPSAPEAKGRTTSDVSNRSNLKGSEAQLDGSGDSIVDPSHSAEAVQAI